MSKYILPSIIIFLILYSFIKKKNTYNSFVLGAKSSFDLVLTSFPYIATIFIAVEIFEVSGLSYMFADFVSPVFEFFGIPKELSQLVILKNFTGCGSLALLENIIPNSSSGKSVKRVISVACVLIILSPIINIVKG